MTKVAGHIASTTLLRQKALNSKYDTVFRAGVGVSLRLQCTKPRVKMQLCSTADWSFYINALTAINHNVLKTKPYNYQN